MDKTLDSGTFVPGKGFGGGNADRGYYFEDCAGSFCIGYYLPACEEQG